MCKSQLNYEMFEIMYVKMIKYFRGYKSLRCLFSQYLWLTHLPLVPHIWVSELREHWFRQWLGAYSVPSSYLNHWWMIVNWTLRKNLVLKIRSFHSWKCVWKCRLPKWRPFCPGEMSSVYYDFVTLFRVYYPGPRFNNGFSIAIQTRLKFRFTLTSILIQWLLHNFVHGTTAVLSWHVQNFVAIWWPATELWQGEVSIEFELRAKNR